MQAYRIVTINLRPPTEKKRQILDRSMRDYGLAVGIFSHFIRKFQFRGTCRLHDLGFEDARLRTQIPSAFIHAARGHAWSMRKNPPQRLRWTHCLSTIDPKNWNIRTTHRDNPVLTLGLVRFARGRKCHHMGYPISQDGAWQRYMQFIKDGWMKRSCMVRLEEGRYMAKIWLRKEVTDVPTKRIIGVDAGLSRLAAATIYDPDKQRVLKQFYIGQDLLRKRMAIWQRKDRLRSKKMCGSSRAKRAWAKTRHYEQNLVTWYCYDVAHQLVRLAKATQAAIAVENLNGLRQQKSKGKKMNRRLHTMPYAQLRTAIKSVATRNGVTVVPVPPRNTSKTCPRCGLVSRRNRPRGRTLFRCISCGYEGNSDRVASLNIAKLGVVELNKPVEREPLGSLQPNHCFEPTAPSQFSTGGAPIGVPDRFDEESSAENAWRAF